MNINSTESKLKRWRALEDIKLDTLNKRIKKLRSKYTHLNLAMKIGKEFRNLYPLRRYDD